MQFCFGVYPGGAAGTADGGLATGLPDDPSSIHVALSDLQSASASPLLVRCYTGFTDDGGPERTDIVSPRNGDRYAVEGRMLDLVLQYRSRCGDVAGFAQFVRNAIRRFGASTRCVQIAEEPNVAGNAVLDGDYPNVLQAIAAGVEAGAQERERLRLDHLRIGTNTTPLFGASAGFYMELVEVGGASLIDRMQYIGLDMFPDVFSPVRNGSLRDATAWLLGYHRRDILGLAGLGHLPLHVTEHGYPTGPGRSAERQAEVLGEVLGAVLEQRHELNIDAYEVFSLRDADSSNPDLFHQFGLMTDTYAPKPAYEVFKRSLREHFEGA
jgi:hypothetical protein